MPYHFIRYGTYALQLQVPTLCGFISTYALRLHQVRYLRFTNFRYQCFVALSVPMPYNFIRYGTYALQLQVPTLCSFISTCALQLHKVRYLRFTTSGTYTL
jgi:hypothetical protein